MDRLILYFNRPGYPSNILNKETAMENLACYFVQEFFSQERIPYLEILYLLSTTNLRLPAFIDPVDL